LSEPIFENKGTKYLITWPDIKLHAEVSRISMNHDTTKCLCIFTSSYEGANPHILQTRLNLESTRARNDLAKDLATRYQIGQSIDWKAITEYLTVKVLREYEKGEPIILLTSDDEIKPLEYLLYPIAPLLKPTVIFGEPGAGKSQIAIIFSMTLCLPWHDNPLKLVPPHESVVTLMLDYEGDPEDAQRQLVSLTKGMSLPYVELHYRRCSLPLAEDIESIRNHVEDIKAQCLIVDSVSLAAGDDPSKPNVATTYFRQLRQLHITSISLAHTSKNKESQTKTIFGSVMWEAGARSVWEIQGQEEEDAFDIALFHRKANLSKKFNPQGYRITYKDKLPVNVSWHNPKEVAEFVEKMSTTDRVLDLLKEGAASMKDIAESLGVATNTAKVSLHRLKKKGLVTKLPDDTWGLSQNE
jgi:hypothetical protein